MALAALLGRLKAATRRWPVLPTADYYLLGGISDLVSADATAPPQRPIVRLGPHAWAHGDRLVFVRYATADEMAMAEGRRWRSVHYVIDDLIPGAAWSGELPADYRARLAQFAGEMLPRILALGPVIVAPSPRILALFPRHRQVLLDPCCLALKDGGPLPAPTPRGDGALRIVFLGTRSHVGSLPLLAAVAARLARDLPAAELHLFFGRHLPAGLRRQANIVDHAPVPWSAFAGFCRVNRFHIALAPVQDTAFAMARSITKVMDHAAVGAAGIYSNREPFRHVITDGVDGLLVGDSAEAWCEAILRLARAPEALSGLAAAGARLAAARGAPERVRRFWLAELGLEVS